MTCVTMTASIGDIINAGLLVLAAVALIFTYLQVRANTRTNRAIFFKELYLTMFSDSDMRDAFYKIEYDQFVYSEKFHKSPEEKAIDRLLSFVDLICNLYYQGLLTSNEMKSFSYELKRIYENSNVSGYLAFLKAFYSQVNTGTQPFAYFLRYCRDELHLGAYHEQPHT